MRRHYDFSNARRNPPAKRLKKQVTIRIDELTLGYFKALGERVGTPYQTLINMYAAESVILSAGERGVVVDDRRM